MFLISHRGNVSGITESENKPSYIDTALKLGYDVEIDVWKLEETFWLGHDKPQYKIDLEYLLTRENKLWCHAKNLSALKTMLDNNIHCFWQEKDDYAITSRGYVFTHSKITEASDLSILISLDATLELPLCAGVCSDYITGYKK